jgi:plasmid stability protein
MAGNLGIRNLDDDIIRRLNRWPALHGRSAEAEFGDIESQAMEAETDIDFERLAADLRKLTAARSQTPAEVLQREGRDER